MVGEHGNPDMVGSHKKTIVATKNRGTINPEPDFCPHPFEYFEEGKSRKSRLTPSLRKSISRNLTWLENCSGKISPNISISIKVMTITPMNASI